MLNEQEFILRSEDETAKLATDLATKIEAGTVIALYGDLGAGKTTICRQIIRSLCGENTRVASPTFNLLQTYSCNVGEVYHFDLYRLKHPEEVYELGFEEALHDNITLIEWPEIISHLLPKNTIHLQISIALNGHRVCKLLPNTTKNQ